VDPNRFGQTQKQRKDALIIGRHSRPGSIKFGVENKALLELKCPYEFRILGTDNDDISKAIGTTPPHNWITYKYASRDVPGFLRELDIYLYITGSFRESWGRSICEAMLTGVPVICRNRDAIPEYVIDGYNGLLVNNESDIVRAIKLVADGKAVHIAECARKLMESLMEPNHYVDRLIRILSGNESSWINAPTIPLSGETWIIELGTESLGKSKAYKYLRISDTSSMGLLRALEFLSGISYDEAMIFGFTGIPSNDIEITARRLGRNRAHTFLCTDQYPINHLPILSHNEGIKRLQLLITNL
jgi:hypothetical protein